MAGGEKKQPGEKERKLLVVGRAVGGWRAEGKSNRGRRKGSFWWLNGLDESGRRRGKATGGEGKEAFGGLAGWKRGLGEGKRQPND